MSLLEGKEVFVEGWELWLPIILEDIWVSPLFIKAEWVVLSILFWIKSKASLLVGKQSFCQEQVNLCLLKLWWLLLHIITCNAIAFLLKFVILLIRQQGTSFGDQLRRREGCTWLSGVPLLLPKSLVDWGYVL